jgi:hypothetical protein
MSKRTRRINVMCLNVFEISLLQFNFRGTNLLDRYTNNGTSDTDGFSRSLLGNALIFALLVEASP